MNIDTFARILIAITEAPPPASLAPDPESCLKCKHHANNLKFDGDDMLHCYMFKTLPDSLCMQFKPAEIRRKTQ